MAITHHTNITVPIMTPSPLPAHPPSPKQQQDEAESPSEPPYNEPFENDLSHALLNLSNRLNKISQRDDADSATAIPLALNAPERIYPISIPISTDEGNAVPNLKTTHPHGSIYGGPNPHFTLPSSSNLSPSEVHALVLERAKSFVTEAGITNRKQVNDVLGKQMEELMRQVEGRARRREDALKSNERVGRELESLREEYEMVRGGIMRNMGR